jgi:hypothetical protein
MNKKKLFGGGIVVILIIISVCLIPALNGKNKIISYIQYFVYGNVIDIHTDDNLDINKVTLVFKNEKQLTIDRIPSYQDRNPYNKAMNVVIFKEGKQIQNIPYDYGKQDVQILYNNIEIGRLGHWQTNKYYSHRYYIHIFYENQKISFTGKIKGPDVMD